MGRVRGGRGNVFYIRRAERKLTFCVAVLFGTAIAVPTSILLYICTEGNCTIALLVFSERQVLVRILNAVRSRQILHWMIGISLFMVNCLYVYTCAWLKRNTRTSLKSMHRINITPNCIQNAHASVTFRYTTHSMPATDCCKLLRHSARSLQPNITHNIRDEGRQPLL